MNKRMKKILCYAIVFLIAIGNMKLEVKAAGGLSISSSASEVKEGETFTVTVKAATNYFVSNISINVSGGSVVTGLGKASLDKGESTTAKIKLTGESCTVSVSGIGANYDTETEETASGSVTVKKKTVVVDNRSKDNNLSAITVSEGTLTPSFQPSVTEYSVTLGGMVEKITINATAKDAKASVSGSGEKALIPGTNTFSIVCTAENGKQKTYTVNIYVDETPLVFTSYGTQKLGVVRNQTDIGVPNTFETTTITLNDEQVQAYHSNQFDLTLVYMVNEVGVKNFYIYDTEEGIVSVFRPVSILGRNVIVFDLSDEEKNRKNMVYTEVTIDEVTLPGWTYENPEISNYIHVLVMNEFGEKVVYQYEKTENSLQLYKEYEEKEDKDNVKGEKFAIDGYSLYIIAGLGGLCILLILSIIIMAATRKQRYSVRKRKYQKKLEKAEKKDN